jgi:ABC-2 type transport system permease protein
MSSFLGVFKYEFWMCFRRKSLWLAYGVLFLFYLLALFNTGRFAERPDMSLAGMWSANALIAFMYNLLLPVVGGISAADRLVRDRDLHTSELIHSTRLSTLAYLLGKYAGVTLGITLPVLAGMLAMRLFFLLTGAPAITLGMTLITFLAVNLPAYLFITAFSLTCPLWIPTRVYQVLFTGYWFWGNFVYPEMFPSLSGTLLQSSGRIPAVGLFGTTIDMGNMVASYSHLDVWINFGLLAICVAAALSAAGFYLAKNKRSA